MATPQQTRVDVTAASTRAAATRSLAANIKKLIGARAISTLRRRMGPEVNREMQSLLNLPKSEISSRINVTSTDSYVQVEASGRRISLSRFGAKWAGHKSAGATAQIWRESPTKTYVGAFAIASGAIFSRALNGAKRVARLPMTKLFGPDLGSVLASNGQHGIKRNLDQFAQQTLSDEIDRLAKIEMGKI